MTSVRLAATVPAPAQRPLQVAPQLVQPKYRADIDGMRAIAVLSVVAYHAFPKQFAGGFIGVDMFFVISGFLISTILFVNFKNERFSFSTFYARRVRRIFPALLVVLAASAVMGWFVLSREEFRQLGKHIFAGCGFASNALLWSEAGYFDRLAESKPLLHLWSLGIEEQFYITWPLALWLIGPRKTRILCLVIVCLVGSLLLNASLVHKYPVATFYDPASRIWELLIGAALAHFTLHPIRNSVLARLANRPSSPIVANAKAGLGLALIGSALLLLTSATAFPGWWALLPTLGTALLIDAGPAAWINRSILSRPALVLVGLISFPLYLWHWPLLVFARIAASETRLPGMSLLTIGLSLLLAWLTYSWVELPIRNNKPGSASAVKLGQFMLLTGCCAFLTMNLDTPTFQHWNETPLESKFRDLDYPITELTYADCPAELRGGPSLTFCARSASGVPTRAVFGDSHADSLFHGLAKVDKQARWIELGENACPPLSGVDVQIAATRDCEKKNEKVISYLNGTPGIHTVVLSFLSEYLLFGPDKMVISSKLFATTDRTELFYLGLEHTVQALEQRGKRVVVVIDVPTLPFSPRDCFGKAADSACRLPANRAKAAQASFRSLLQRLAVAHPGIRLYDTFEVLCDEQTCHFETPVMSLYRDTNHLSLRGSEVVARDFLNWLSHP